MAARKNKKMIIVFTLLLGVMIIVLYQNVFDDNKEMEILTNDFRATLSFVIEDESGNFKESDVIPESHN